MDDCRGAPNNTPPPSAGADKEVRLGAPPSSYSQVLLTTPLYRQSHQHSRSRRQCREQQPTPASCDDSLVSLSLQQEPDSAASIERLIRLARCRLGCAQTRSHAMVDFLASFNLGAQTATQSNNLPCNSVDDLQLHLRRFLDAKTAPNRAEHVSMILELRATVQFTIALPGTENDNDDASNNIDPALGGGNSTTAPGDQAGEPPSRVVVASEALMNQPQEDPSLQRSVATHIIEALGAVDGSTWAVRDMSRGAQSWKFTYACKDSFQQWSRQHAKHLAKAVVGEYSQRELDPTLSSRPAFDCRGTVIIDFDRNRRAITVKYDHTPLHKTVAELSEYFKPAPRELGPGAQRQLQQKTLQQKALQQKTPKKQRPDKRAQDELGNARKRKKKNDGESQAMLSRMSIMAPPGNSVSVLEDGQPQPASSYSQVPQPQDAGSGQHQQASSDYPEDLLGGESVQPTSQPQAQKAGSQPPTGPTLPVKISPAEATRRRDAAMAMLSRAGVPPESLSADQFTIFSNQSPDLQKESLGMLVKYGAERLRIVHPENKGGSNVAQANASPGQSSVPNPSGPMTTKELVPQGGGSSDADTAGGSAANAGDDGPTTTPGPTTTGRRKLAKSRNACYTCKGRKVKCPRERPTCSECSSQGLVCEMPPYFPRTKKKKAKAKATDELGEDEEADYQEDEAHEDAEGDEVNQEDAGQHIHPQDHSSYPQMPVSNTLTSAVGALVHGPLATHANYFNSSSGSALSQDEAPSIAHGNVNAADEYTYNTTMTDQTRRIENQTVPYETNTDSPTHSKWGVSDSASRSRRNIPSEPARTGAQDAPSTTNQSLSDWNTGANNGRLTAEMASGSPHMAHPGTMDQRAQPADHQRHQPPTTSAAMLAQARVSPFQAANAPRAKSRQGQRAQSRTSVGDQTVTRGYQPPADRNQRTRADNGYHTPDHMGGTKHSDWGRSGTTTNSMANHQSSQKSDHGPYPQPPGASSLSQIADASSRIAKIAISMSSQAPSTMATSYQTSSSSQWSGSPNKNERSHNSTSTYQSQNTYSQPSSSRSGSASRQNYNTQGSTQPTRSEDNSFSHQQQSYSQYPPPTQHQESQTNNQANIQQQGWYGFNTSNSGNSFRAAH
ncbi:hypothetical protein G7Z17_g8327 [Cylindrodendrum hubeiense]|uniref:Zn(2)-C6 fungal-type domain-containing protein n=1 Tax=Cylindrodendrum hubeiense TaxID=595255 RepID=A0A9P5H5E1_9HYPO|nr:hypothetical protein G7Z17_g8327 [Cylindrodendrum hubeiense]